MSKLGAYLKQERERKSLSLHEIGMSLKINPKILSALEEGQAEGLPAKTFLRGFVKSYAQYLRLNTDEALRLFQEEYGPSRPEMPRTLNSDASPATTPIPTISSGSDLTKNRPLNQEKSDGGKVFFVGGGILLFVLVIFVAKMVDKYQKERPEKIPVAAIAAPTPSESPSPSPEDLMSTPIPGESPSAPTSSTGAPTQSPTQMPAATLSVSPTLAPSPIMTTTRAPSPTPSIAPSSTPTKAPSLVPTPSRTPTPTPSPSPSPTAAAPKSPTPAPTKSPTTTPTATPTATPAASVSPAPTTTPRPNEIIIEALGKVSIKYTNTNTGKSQSVELNADQLHTFRAKGPVALEFSDGGAVNIIVNGKDLGIPGSAGKPHRITVP